MFFRANKKWALAHSSLPSNHRCGHGSSLRRNKIVRNCHHTSRFFGFQWAKKVMDGERGFLQGFLAILVVFTMVKRGELCGKRGQRDATFVKANNRTRF